MPPASKFAPRRALAGLSGLGLYGALWAGAEERGARGGRPGRGGDRASRTYDGEGGDVLQIGFWTNFWSTPSCDSGTRLALAGSKRALYDCLGPLWGAAVRRRLSGAGPGRGSALVVDLSHRRRDRPALAGHARCGLSRNAETAGLVRREGEGRHAQKALLGMVSRRSVSRCASAAAIRARRRGRASAQSVG